MLNNLMEQPFELALLPLSIDVETKKVLRKVTEAHKHLAELKGIVRTIPNESILINTLVLQEAKDSSAVENIITTHDEIFKAELFNNVYKKVPFLINDTYNVYKKWLFLINVTSHSKSQLLPSQNTSGCI
jgi:hypothetical protein